MARVADFVQWDGEYSAAMKMNSAYAKQAGLLAKERRKAAPQFGRRGQTAKDSLKPAAPSDSNFWPLSQQFYTASSANDQRELRGGDLRAGLGLDLPEGDDCGLHQRGWGRLRQLPRA